MKYNVAIPEKDLYVSFDHDKLEKVLYNLLSNAFKFTPDRGSVTLSAAYKNERLVIEVADNGIGIPAIQQPRIFDRFYQSDDSLTREWEGAGIGLALAKELISLMGGDIQVESTQEEGAVFKVMLPLIETRHMPEEQIDANLAPLSHLPANLARDEIRETKENEREGPLILIVEDNSEMRDFIGKQLKNDYQIIEAVHGKSGLEKAQSNVPDLIITDLMMPQMDGMELCKLLKTDERTSHIPVIMLTAKAGQEHKIEGLQTGADDYLTKPFDRTELRARVSNLIRQRQNLREKFSKEITLQPRNISITSIDERFLKKVEETVEENLADSSFGVPQMQEALTMSKTQLHRKIKALTDQSPGEYIRNYRLKRAAQIISQKGDNVTQVAYAVGFNNLSYFAKCFKELYGVAPSSYSEHSPENSE